MRIHSLSSHVANQIAAGEVIERPSSIIKELIENSIDAHATQIILEVEQGGLRRLCVRDNGEGIHQEDLALALERHATSKVRLAEDLFHIATLGFRGEALASIAAVAKVVLTSKPLNAHLAYQISNEGNKSIIPAAHPTGTSLEASDLFYNIPARRKFLRSTNNEFQHIQEIVTRMALCHFGIGFRLTHNQQSTLDFPSALCEQSKLNRIAKLWGDDFVEAAIAIEYRRAGLTLTGWLADPSLFSRGRPDMNYFYLNGRFIRDRVLAHALRQGCSDIIYQDRHLASILYLEMDPASVDVNVHPTKHEVRFKDSRLVHDFLVNSIQTTVSALKPSCETRFIKPFKETIDSSSPLQESATLYVCEDTEKYSENHGKHQANECASEVTLGYPIGQLHSTYILAQNEKGLLIIDMHAAHERILYERMKLELKQHQLAIEPLLIPITVHLTAIEMACWHLYQNSFNQLGLQSELLGTETIVIRSLPALLNIKSEQVSTLVHDVLSDLTQMGKSQRIEDRIYETLGNLACRAAIRAPHRLTLPEMEALLNSMMTTQHSGHCNHGRPTWRHISMNELDSYFLRGR